MLEYLKVFEKANPEKEVIGYWKVKNGYVFNTKVSESYVGCSQFLVTDDGIIYGTNPIVNDLDPEKMILITK